jgi:hypothetical protein
VTARATVEKVVTRGFLCYCQALRSGSLNITPGMARSPFAPAGINPFLLASKQNLIRPNIREAPRYAEDARTLDQMQWR